MRTSLPSLTANPHRPEAAGSSAPTTSRLGNDCDREALWCRTTDDLFTVIAKCLGNGTGHCVVVDDSERLIGSIDLESIRRSIREGELSITQSWAGITRTPSGGSLTGEESPLRATVDSNGRLLAVGLDRSQQYVQIARPDLSGLEFRLLLDAFLSTWISSCGEYLAAFQSQFAALLGCRHAIAVSNGTMALQLALAALDIGPGDEVILPDLTFAATINAVLHAGATPVIVDIDPDNWGIDVTEVRRAVTPRTRAIIPVHLYGRPAELGALMELANKRRIAVIEDCAQALGAHYDDRPVGQFGDVGCFSFFANKTITTGEGGICVTNSDQLAAKLKVLRDHGMNPGRRYWHERAGFNGRMTNLQASIGVGQLARFEEIVARNLRIEALYRQHLDGIPGVEFPPLLPNHIEPTIWLVSVLVPAEQRATLIEAAARSGIEIRPFFYPLSAMPPYRQFGRLCPNSVALSQSGINLPTSNGVDEDVVRKVAVVFSNILRRVSEHT